MLSVHFTRSFKGKSGIFREWMKNGEKTAVEVETGLSTGSQTEIKSGLKEGDEIVIR